MCQQLRLYMESKHWSKWLKVSVVRLYIIYIKNIYNTNYYMVGLNRIIIR